MSTASLPPTTAAATSPAATTPVPGAYMSRVFRAVTDELFKFGVSARVYRDGQTIGVVAATVTTDARMAWRIWRTNPVLAFVRLRSRKS